MVRHIKSNGALMLTPIGGLNPNNVETSNVTVLTKFAGSFCGTIQIENASSHVNAKVNDPRTFDGNLEVLLDECVDTPEQVRALGIDVGDFVALEPRYVYTPSGFIKSRFLDDKAGCAVLLALARAVAEQKPNLTRAVHLHFSVFEEIGRGGATLTPRDVRDIIAVDMGCVGKLQAGSERKVSICAKDSQGPYHYGLFKELCAVAQRENIAHAVDTYFRYGSDAGASLAAGYDARTLTLGPGVYASHGYERTHRDALVASFDLLWGYLCD